MKYINVGKIFKTRQFLNCSLKEKTRTVVKHTFAFDWISLLKTTFCNFRQRKMFSSHLDAAFKRSTWCIFSPVPPQKAGGPRTTAVCQPCRGLHVKEKRMEKEISTQIVRTADCEWGPVLFFQPSYWQKRGEAKTQEQETTFQLSLGIQLTQWKLWRSCTLSSMRAGSLT